MEMGDTKYYRVKQLVKNGRCIGDLILIGRAYGYIVQLHYYDVPGYKYNQEFDSMNQAERFFDDVLREEK